MIYTITYLFIAFLICLAVESVGYSINKFKEFPIVLIILMFIGIALAIFSFSLFNALKNDILCDCTTINDDFGRFLNIEYVDYAFSMGIFGAGASFIKGIFKLVMKE